MIVGIIDIACFSNDKGLYSKYTNSSMHSIMPQVIGSYAERLGNLVWYYPCFDLNTLYDDINLNVDIVFISSYTMNAYLAYAIANIYRQHGITTVIGGPHARSFPEDCRKYFDYVIGLCDFDLIKKLLRTHNDRDTLGIHLTNDTQPDSLPSIKERWDFLLEVYKKTPKAVNLPVPVLSSTGCVNDCEFCIDSQQKFKPFPISDVRNDLLFLKRQNKKFNVLWHDPNFGIRFDHNMDVIEQVDADNLSHICEMNIHKLTERNCITLQKNNIIAVAPGLESWKSYGCKSLKGLQISDPIKKVRYINETMKMVNKYIPIIQLNMIFGLDIDTKISHEDAFTLTEILMRKTPGIYTNFQTLTIFGESTPIGKTLEKDDRVLNIPFHLLNGFSYSNVKLLCDPSKFYMSYAYLLKAEKSFKLLCRRVSKCKPFYGKLFYFLKNLTGRLDIDHFINLSDKIKYNQDYHNFFTGKSKDIPKELYKSIEGDLGKFYNFLPDNVFD